MPVNVVKTPADEKRWTECKSSVHAAHPEMKESNDRFYAMVMGCFTKRKQATKSRRAKV